MPAATPNTGKKADKVVAPASDDKSAKAAAQGKPLATAAVGDGTEGSIAKYEKYFPWLILVVAFATRYYRLTDPPGVVFDEYHFGRFVNQYCAGTYLFDIHPPLGKLVLLFVGKLFGYDHTVCSYNAIQDEYRPECKYYVLRATAAAFGTATAPLMYWIVRGFGGGIWSALLCASFFVFDNLNLTESRLVLIDSQLIFWCAASLAVAQRWWARHRDDADARERWAAYTGRDISEVGGVDHVRGVGYDASGVPKVLGGGRWDEASRTQAKNDLAAMMGSLERNLWCVAVAVTCSSAISIKWTGLATPGMIAVESFFGFFFLKGRPVPLPDLLKIAALAFALYYTWFHIHFDLLPRTGDGDAFMRIEFQRTLINNTNYDPLAPHPGYLTTFFQLNHEMLAANARIDVRHNWESLWWEWPLNLRGLLYYSKDLANTYTKTVYLLGNPGVIWIVGVFVILSAASTVFYLRYKSNAVLQLERLFGRFFTAVGYCQWVYVLNLLPYILVSRSAFIYHYMPALMYGEVLTALMIEQLVGKRNMPNAMKVLMAVILATFLFYAPWVYAAPLTNEGHARRRWLKRWD